jgi:hypothetical protein
MKTLPVGAKLFYDVRRTDGQTGLQNRIHICFSKFRKSAYERIDSLLRKAAKS